MHTGICKPLSLNQPKLVCSSTLVSQPDQATLLAGFRGVLGTFQLVTVKHELGQSGKIQLDLTSGPNAGQIKKCFIHMQSQSQFNLSVCSFVSLFVCVRLGLNREYTSLVRPDYGQFT